MKKFRVHGICFVPNEAEIIVHAKDTNGALLEALKAWRTHKSDLIVSNSSDKSAAFDWEPSAEEIK